MIEVDEVIGLIGIGKHGRLRNLLSSYVDGEVNPSEASRVENHLSGCNECRQELETLTATVHLLRELPELEIPRTFVLQSAPTPARAARGYVWVPRLATSFAAALLLVVVLGDVTGILDQSGKVALAPAVSESAAAAVAAPIPAATPEPVAAMAAAAPMAPPDEQPEAEATDEAETEDMVAAAPVPEQDEQPEAEAMVEAETEEIAAAAPVPEQDGQPDEEVVVDVPTDQSTAELNQEPEVAPEPPVGPEEPGGVELPLWQLEVAIGVVLGVLLLVAVWSARRRKSWSP